MKEERLSFNHQELEWYVARARKLRNKEISRLARLFLHLPVRLVQRVSNKANQAANIDRNSADQSA